MKPFNSSIVKVTLILLLVGKATGSGVSAQIVPDLTLPNPSVVNVEGEMKRITGGTTVGGNLFHSFREFNVGTGETAHFENALTLDNIITRITGTSVSNIDGLIRTNGTANLFFIAPNGIVFGPNASLDIGGSFMSSTADSIQFADGSIYSATDPSDRPLLTANIPIGLQYGNNAAPVRVRGSTLAVQPGNTLSLIGGNVITEGATIRTPGGRLELGGLSASGTVQLNGSGAIAFPEGVKRSDVTLSDRTQVEVAAAGGGSITVNARHLTLSDRSQIRAGIAEGLGQNGVEAGDIQINATGHIKLTGESAIANEVQPNAVGNGGDVTVRTTSFSATRAFVSTTTFGQGNGGQLTLNATDWIEFDGEGADDFLTAASGDVGPGGEGNAGGVAIATNSIFVRDGARIVSGTRGNGNGGPLIVRATDSVVFDGFNSSNDVLTPTGAESTVDPESTGNAGSLAIETGSLFVLNGANVGITTFEAGNGGSVTLQATQMMEFGGTDRNGNPVIVFSDTLAAGDGGNLAIATPRLMMRDGAQISVGTFGAGQGGNLEIVASEAIELTGAVPMTPGGFFFLDVSGAQFPTGIFGASTDTGNAGMMRLRTGQLIVRDRSEISVSSESLGVAGDLDIVASDLLLDNGSLRAETVRGDRANIMLTSDRIILRGGSQIAIDAMGNATAGNITIDTDTLVALENSDITANAAQSFGGRVIINARGIFGTEFREQLTSDSDITASSKRGSQFSGQVTLNTLQVQPASGLLELLQDVLHPSDRVILSCGVTRGNSLIVTGRGGLPEDPTATIRGQTIWRDFQAFSEETHDEKAAVIPLDRSPSDRPLVEATGWIVDAEGNVQLTADFPHETNRFSAAKSLSCDRFYSLFQIGHSSNFDIVR